MNGGGNFGKFRREGKYVKEAEEKGYMNPRRFDLA